MSPDSKVLAFAERVLSIRCTAKADMDTLRQQIIEADLDPAAVTRLASWLEKDEAKRAEQDAVDEQYRFLAGLLPEPAELPEESQIAKAAALYADKLTVRAVAKEMGVSVGRAHKLKVLAAAFTVHERVNVNKRAAEMAERIAIAGKVADLMDEYAAEHGTQTIDPETGEVIEETQVVSAPAGGGDVDAVAEGPSATPAATPLSSGGMGEAPVAHAEGVSTTPKPTPAAPLDTRSFDEIAGEIPAHLRRVRAA